MYHKDCLENGLLEIRHLYNDNKLLDRNMINIVYGVELTVMEYNSLISAIPRQWRKYMSDEQQVQDTDVKIENNIIGLD